MAKKEDKIFMHQFFEFFYKFQKVISDLFFIEKINTIAISLQALQ